MNATTKYNEKNLIDLLNSIEDIDTTHVLLVERDGFLILEGNVSSYPEIFELEQRILSETNIQVLLNSLEVRSADQITRDDRDICKEIVETMSMNESFQKSRLRYSIRGAVVTVSGVAQHSDDIEKVVQILKGIEGVEEVLHQA